MQESYNKNITPIPNNDINKITVIQTDQDAKNGQSKCPKCGSTDIQLNTLTGKLRCNFCRYEFEPEKVKGMQEDISQLQGQVIASGAADIVADTKDILTLKCSSCGAEVVIDTASASQARCHWCRNTLSINQQIPNGNIPDVVLPFKISRDEAKIQIEDFVKKRKFFAHTQFKKEFTTENIMGVYFPYMIIDANAHVNLQGQGEHLVKVYYEGNSDNRMTYYDADTYQVGREFDVVIKDLTVESSSDKLNQMAEDKTNNIINSIMPFDIENCVKFDANYLKGYTSEKRDTNIDQLRLLVANQSRDIAKFSINNTLKLYDRGVAWDTQDFKLKGQQWKSGYLPVWLYSYQQVKRNKSVIHYVAVNARTKETMGSIPMHMPKVVVVSTLVEILGIFGFIEIDSDYSFLFLFVGVVFYFFILSIYRNKDARHKYELETKTEVSNLKKIDKLVGRRTRLTSSRIQGANNTTINSANQGLGSELINSIIDSDPTMSFIKNSMEKNDNKQ